MFLHYFRRKVIKDNSLSHDLYLEILRLVNNIFDKNEGNIKKDFNSSYEIFSIFLIVILYAAKNNKTDYSKINQELMNKFIDDLDYSMREIGVSDMKVGKHVKAYVKKFYFRISSLEIILKNQDYLEFEKYIISLEIFNNFDLFKQKNQIFYKELNKIIDSIAKHGVNKNILLDIFI